MPTTAERKGRRQQATRKEPLVPHAGGRRRGKAEVSTSGQRERSHPHGAGPAAVSTDCEGASWE